MAEVLSSNLSGPIVLFFVCFYTHGKKINPLPWLHHYPILSPAGFSKEPDNPLFLCVHPKTFFGDYPHAWDATATGAEREQSPRERGSHDFS
jgi:hypothetical protein